MLNLIKFGLYITEKRLELNMTQQQIANKLYVTPQAVSKWERGESFPDIETLVLLCYDYNIPIDSLLNECFESKNLSPKITLENVEEYLHSTHRKEILKQIIDQDLLPIRITTIFYLLNVRERLDVIDKVISGDIDIDYTEFIVLLNPAERKRFLSGLLENNCNIIDFSHLLSPLEKTRYIRD